MKKWILLQALLLSLALNAQTITFRGKVADPTGKPIEKAVVTVERLPSVLVTDSAGMFQFDMQLNENRTIVITHLAYDTLKATVSLPMPNNVFVLRQAVRVLPLVLIVESIKAGDNTPTTYVNINKKELAKGNLGQDLPLLLQYTPSLVASSDAGGGVGYTGMRIRGSDITRINVTVNGIPINDAESHGVFWVNMPDFASSVNSMQIQRGAGTSTNGAGAFGASINTSTLGIREKAYGETSHSFGSFNTRKHTALFGTGLLNKHFAFEGRLSRIVSDGYIDRAFSDLSSYYFSGMYKAKRSGVQFITFAGKERTYQAWYGTPESRLKNDVAAMNAHADNEGYTDEQRANLLQSGRSYNYYLYENETDNYRQDHYQLHLNHRFLPFLSANVSLFYTKGAGYYEQYRRSQKFADYGLNDPVVGSDTISRSNLIRQRWLDNDFYGMVYSLKFDHRKTTVVLGGGANEYRGAHFGEIIWAEIATNMPKNFRYYNNNSYKSDINSFVKYSFLIHKVFNVFADLQVRRVYYSGMGTDNDLVPIAFSKSYTFFNPKFGATYFLSQKSLAYASVSVANREPVRSDIIDAPQGMVPKPERLYNVETGFKHYTEKLNLEANLFYMHYVNQLVLTGELNDVGAAIRKNVPESFRAGIELNAAIKLSKKWKWETNVALSANKIKEFTEVYYAYDANFDWLGPVANTYQNTTIAFSPAVVAFSGLSFLPNENLSLTVLQKYTGKQFIDNTSNPDKAIDAYFVSDFRCNYTLLKSLKGIQQIDFTFMLNNFTNLLYANNGYTYSYQYDNNLVSEEFYYPQAGINFLAGIAIKF